MPDALLRLGSGGLGMTLFARRRSRVGLLGMTVFLRDGEALSSPGTRSEA